jgi:hypothetical protein
VQFVENIQRAWLDGGAKTVFTRGLRKVMHPAVRFGTLVFIECDLHGPMPERRAAPGIIVREATMEDVGLFEDQDLFRERRKQGHRCFMGIEEATGKLTNYRWVNCGPAYIPELERYLMLNPGQAYVYDLNTVAEFRRRGIDGYTRHCTYTHLRDTGYSKVYAYIHGDNGPSLRASRHLLKPVGRLWYFQIRGCQPIMIGGRWHGFPELRKLSANIQGAQRR